MGVAFVFDGQGAQWPGMGKALSEASVAAKAVFDMADSIRPGTSAQCFEGGREELADTANTQPCLYTVNLAAAMALKERGVTPACLAGFSLGELSALAFAGSMSPEEGLRLTITRGRLMADEAGRYPGAMAAVIGLTAADVEALCAETVGFAPANYNAPAQTVVSGLKDALPAFKEAAALRGGRVMPLNVSGAFHSVYMRGAADGFLQELEKAEMRKPAIPVYANLTAAPYGEEIKDTLAGQISGPVRWVETIQRMKREGIDTFVAMGAGNTLCGLIKKIYPEAVCHAVSDAQSLEAAVSALNQKEIST